jgi:GAF domain-containing protein
MGSDVIESGVTQAVSQVSHEGDRLAALRRYDVLDTPCEPEFDDLVRLAAEACEAPVAVISLVEDRRQWFKAEVGLELRETSLVESICAQTIRQPGLFVVPDASKDPRFDDNPVVKGRPHLRFYAGARLDTPEGLPLGALCVLDTRPRQDLTDGQKFALQVLARQVMVQLELRRAVAERDEALMEGPMRVVLDGPPVDLAADLAIPVGMALHELTSNAVRHGALSVPQGRVEVRWDLTRRDGKRKLILSWAEHDGPPVQEPRKRGFGSTLLERVLALQANAEVRIAYGREGLTFRLEAPLVEQRLVPEY